MFNDLGVFFVQAHRNENLFVKRIKDVHGDSFSLIPFTFTGYKNKVKIKCNSCLTIFEIDPSSFLRWKRKKCKSCQSNVRLTNEEIIKRCTAVHGKKYDYSLIDYEKTHPDIEYICEIHGLRKQNLHDHLNGHGCRKCGLIERAKNQIIPVDDWIKRFNKVHNGKYQYDKQSYCYKSKSINLICDIHGPTKCSVDHHVLGSGCPKCAGVAKITKEEFFERCKTAHKNKYVYKDSVYTSLNEKITYFCPHHGSVSQQAANHMKGYGCSKCSAIENSWLSKRNIENSRKKNLPCKIYHVRFTNRKSGKVFDKIGVTIRTVADRYYVAKNDGFDYEIINTANSTRLECVKLESDFVEWLNKSNKGYRVHDLKNTRIGGWTECFINTPEAQEKIDEIFNSIKTQRVII